MHDLTGKFIILDAFNLWPGAVITERGMEDAHSFQVVTTVIRNADTEEVVLLYRDLDFFTMTETSGPGVLPRTTVEVANYSDPYRVYGNVVNPDDFGDNNLGQDR